MERVIITSDSDLFAVWRVQCADGTRAERSVQVGDALRTLIVARSTFQRLLDDIQTDTFPRTGV